MLVLVFVLMTAVLVNGRIVRPLTLAELVQSGNTKLMVLFCSI
jgi:hypothetical protein